MVTEETNGGIGLKLVTVQCKPFTVHLLADFLFFHIPQGSQRAENLRITKELKDEMDVLIECRDVYKSFGEKHILRGVSFNVNFHSNFYKFYAWVQLHGGISYRH